MNILWDNDKNQINIKKHGISFEEAQEIFDDPLHISILDKRFNYGEERWISLGKTKEYILIVVAHTYMDIDGNERIRIISARKATKKERRDYENYEI